MPGIVLTEERAWKAAHPLECCMPFCRMPRVTSGERTAWCRRCLDHILQAEANARHRPLKGVPMGRRR